MKTWWGRIRLVFESQSQKNELKEGSNLEGKEQRDQQQSVKQEWKQGGVRPHRVDELHARSGSSLLFQANFTGSNLRAPPDTEQAAAICLEISSQIGSMEKKTENKNNKKEQGHPTAAFIGPPLHITVSLDRQSKRSLNDASQTITTYHCHKGYMVVLALTASQEINWHPITSQKRPSWHLVIHVTILEFHTGNVERSEKGNLLLPRFQNRRNKEQKHVFNWLVWQILFSHVFNLLTDNSWNFLLSHAAHYIWRALRKLLEDCSGHVVSFTSSVHPCPTDEKTSRTSKQNSIDNGL